ncbi:MAG: hypothetical protein AB4040_12990 [Synechococcus sp.]
MERYVKGVGKQILGGSQVIAVRLRDSAIRIGSLSLTLGNQYFSKTRIILSDTISVAKDSLGSKN